MSETHEKKNQGPISKFCRQCGAKIQWDSRYCEACGAKLEGALTVPAAPSGSEVTQKCAKCGTELPPVGWWWYDGKHICQRCAEDIRGKILAPFGKEEKERGTKGIVSGMERVKAWLSQPLGSARREMKIKQTLASILSLSGVTITLFAVFLYMPQFSIWAVVGASALLGLYHPWWQPKKPKEPSLQELNELWHKMMKDYPPTPRFLAAGFGSWTHCSRCGRQAFDVYQDEPVCYDCKDRLDAQ